MSNNVKRTFDQDGNIIEMTVQCMLTAPVSLADWMKRRCCSCKEYVPATATGFVHVDGLFMCSKCKGNR